MVLTCREPLKLAGFEGIEEYYAKEGGRWAYKNGEAARAVPPRPQRARVNRLYEQKNRAPLDEGRGRAVQGRQEGCFPSGW